MTDATMVQFECPGSPPSLSEAAARLGVPAEALDTGFGVIATSPAEHLYTVLVAAPYAAAAGAQAGDGPAAGRFANPPIDTFGPPSE